MKTIALALALTFAAAGQNASFNQITLIPKADGTVVGQFRVRELQANGTNYVTVKGADALADSTGTIAIGREAGNLTLLTVPNYLGITGTSSGTDLGLQIRDTGNVPGINFYSGTTTKRATVSSGATAALAIQSSTDAFRMIVLQGGNVLIGGTSDDGSGGLLQLTGFVNSTGSTAGFQGLNSTNAGFAAVNELAVHLNQTATRFRLRQPSADLLRLTSSTGVTAMEWDWAAAATDVKFTAHATPAVDVTYDLGTSARRWNKLWVEDIDISGACSGCGGGGGLPVSDSTSVVEGSVDNTKELRFEVDGFTTGTTRVGTFQDADTTVAGINLAQTFALNQTFAANILAAADNVSNIGDATNRFGTLTAARGSFYRVGAIEAGDQYVETRKVTIYDLTGFTGAWDIKARADVLGTSHLLIRNSAGAEVLRLSATSSGVADQFIKILGDVLPYTDNTHDLGTALLRYDQGFIRQVRTTNLIGGSISWNAVSTGTNDLEVQGANLVLDGNSHLRATGTASSPATAGMGYIFYNNGTNRWQATENGGAAVDLTGAASCTVDCMTLTTTQTATGAKTFQATMTTRAQVPETDNTYALGLSGTRYSNFFTMNAQVYSGLNIKNGAQLNMETGSRLAGDFIPVANNTYDLGSASLQYNDLFVTNTIVQSGTTRLTNAGDGNFTTLQIGGTTTLNASRQWATSSLSPSSTSFTLGSSSSVYWDRLYVANLDMNSVSGGGNFYLRTFSGGDISCGGVGNGWIGLRTDTNELQVCNGGAMKKVGLI